MADATKNAALWDSVCVTDAKYTKQFSRGGGFKGTATNATWLARQATRAFGPCGIGWGFSVVDERYVEGKPGDIVHVVRIKLWYVLDGVRGEIEQFGQTTFVGANSKGSFTDEEAPKKSLTDAMSKCLSLLGFASDIHLGLWDDNKYADDRARHAGGSDDTHVGPRGAYGPEETARAEEQAVHVGILAKNFGDAFTAMTHVDDVLEWVHKSMDGIDALGEPGRKSVLATCKDHVKAGRVEGLNYEGFKDLWNAARNASREKANGGKRR